ncbi:ribosomal protein l7 l12 c-terminal domain containing protein [Stylonychia lemnae]|uniref:Ribosomal protein l7 l12 c-terminal domain containing protein n=1 Tax=Stylonychia lemnae TaxID=5949 RepID=A0A078AUS4_STYLE|nr:ribosomal protein l7 l12 c-terminal domain containing protein [Stylonychia lemnae]|eukprot:CDW85761.1 ribosomal protein l7 l12 c-terminal domain containing protein [Stylonychia lemnae]
MIHKQSKSLSLQPLCSIRARLDNLVKSASMYKTKACGVQRNTQINAGSNWYPSGMGSITNKNNRTSFAPSSRVIIEQANPSQLPTQRNSSIGKRKPSNSSTRIAISQNSTQKNKRKSIDVHNSSNKYNNSANILQSVQRNNRNSSKSYINSSRHKDQNSIVLNQMSGTMSTFSQSRKIQIPPYLQEYQEEEDFNKSQTLNDRSHISNNHSRTFSQSNKPDIVSSNNSSCHTNQSLKSFYEDAEFIEFLKNISLFVTSEQSPRESEASGGSKLYSNLQFLRDRFQEYKQKKSTQTQSYQSQMPSTISQKKPPELQYSNITHYYDDSSNSQTIQTERNITISNKSPLQDPKHKPSKFTSQQQQYKQCDSQNSKHSKPFSQPRPDANKTKKQNEQLRNLPEKQRKQIEFIDEIYEKIVLNKSNKSSLHSSQIEAENKENLSYKKELQKTPQQLNLQVKQHQEVSPSAQENSSFYSYQKQAFSYLPTNKCLDSNFKNAKENDDENMTNDQRILGNSSSYLLNYSNISKKQNHSDMRLQTPKETLKALSDTAMQLKQACAGISQFTHIIQGQNQGILLSQNTANRNYQNRNLDNQSTESSQIIITPREYSDSMMTQQQPPYPYQANQYDNSLKNIAFQERKDFNNYDHSNDGKNSENRYKVRSQGKNASNQNVALNQNNVAQNHNSYKRARMLKKQRVLAQQSYQLLASNIQVLQKQTTLMNDLSVRYFSAQEPTADQLAKGKEEWGEKYQDDMFKFEKEWKKISAKITAEQNAYVADGLSDLQKRKVEVLTDKLLDFNIFELRYFSEALKQRIQRTSGVNPMKLNLDWPSLKPDETGSWPPANPNWFKQQEMLAQLGPAMSQMGFGAVGGGGAASEAPAAKKEAAPEKKEEPKEKSHYDIELSKFDPAKKITLIKEVRALLNLGLKEAKEMVEGAPVWLKKEVSKEEAEKLAAKLKELGGECRLA